MRRFLLFVAVVTLGACRTRLDELALAAPADLGGDDAKAAPGGPAWPMIDHDPQHSRRSPLAGPDAARRHLASIELANNPGATRDPIIGGDGTVFADDNMGTLRAFAPADLSVLWSRAGGAGRVGAPLLGPDGTLYETGTSASGRATVVGIDPRSGRVTWEYAGCDAWPSAMGDDGTIYGVCDKSVTSVFAITPGAAEVRWRQPSAVAVEAEAPGGLLVASSSGDVAILDGATGAQRGAIPYPYCRTIDALGNLRCIDGQMRGYFLRTLALPGGALAWSFANYTKFYAALGWAETPDGGLVMTDGPLLYALDTHGIWTPLATIPDGHIGKFNPTIDRDGNLYFSTHDGSDRDAAIVSYDGRGALRWRYPIAEGARYVSSPISIGPARTLVYTTCAGVAPWLCRLDALAP